LTTVLNFPEWTWGCKIWDSELAFYT